MVGLGTQDGLVPAQAFLKRHKISAMKLLWDKTGVSWTKLGIPAQPAWILIAPDGTITSSNLGTIPYATILKGLKSPSSAKKS